LSHDELVNTDTKSIAVRKTNLEELELLTVSELAELLKVKKTWVYGHIHARSLPFPMLKVGHYPRFPLSGVRKFIESKK